MFMMIVGLDLGATTGWAVADEKKEGHPILESGYAKLADRRAPAQRYVNLLHLLDELEARVGGHINTIYYEYVYMPHKSTDAAYAYGGYKACLEVWCEKKMIKLQGVLCSSARKDVLGNGGLNKADAFEKIKERFPHLLISDHNQADAVLVAHYGMTTYKKPIRKKKQKPKFGETNKITITRKKVKNEV